MSRKRHNTGNQRPQEDMCRVFPKNPRQEMMIDSIRNKPITIVQGKAGVGKSLIALAEACWMVNKGLMDKILYVKPIVDFAEQKSLGFLPGTTEEKTAPLLYPVLDNLSVFMSPGKAKYLIDKKVIEFMPLEFIRGRSLRDTVIIGDEFQNASPHCVLSVISRIEVSSKAIIMGDPQQQDIKLATCGLTDACIRLKGLDQVGIVKFLPQDIVRSGFLKQVIQRYDN